VTTSLREAIHERDDASVKPAQPEPEVAAGITFDFEKEPDKLNALVSDAMKDVQEEIDLQSLVNDAMAEFQGYIRRWKGRESANVWRKNSVSRRKNDSDSPNRYDRSRIKAGHSHDRQDFV
jgi:hypothetical protein